LAGATVLSKLHESKPKSSFLTACALCQPCRDLHCLPLRCGLQPIIRPPAAHPIQRPRGPLSSSRSKLKPDPWPSTPPLLPIRTAPSPAARIICTEPSLRVTRQNPAGTVRTVWHASSPQNSKAQDGRFAPWRRPGKRCAMPLPLRLGGADTARESLRRHGTCQEATTCPSVPPRPAPKPDVDHIHPKCDLFRNAAVGLGQPVRGPRAQGHHHLTGRPASAPRQARWVHFHQRSQPVPDQELSGRGPVGYGGAGHRRGAVQPPRAKAHDLIVPDPAI